MKYHVVDLKEKWGRALCTDTSESQNYKPPFVKNNSASGDWDPLTWASESQLYSFLLSAMLVTAY